MVDEQQQEQATVTAPEDGTTSARRSGLRTVQEAMSVRRVFGEPVVRDGVTVIPVARIVGGYGGGRGSDKAGGTGSGLGFGLAAQPLGVFVIKEGRVRWLPTVDVNRVIFGGQLVAIVALLLVRAIVTSRRR
jgi:uncharacterized spore protein YtfJ